MKTTLISVLGFILIVQITSSPTRIVNGTIETNETDYTKNGTTKDQITGKSPPKLTNDVQHTILKTPNATTEIFKRTDPTNTDIMEDYDVTIIDLEKINKMSPVEFIGRQIKSLWHYILHGSQEEKETTFVGRCAKLAKKIGQLIPLVMAGGAIIITKLAFLLLFSLKTIGLLGLLLLLNVGTTAAKLGALLASKKPEHSAQNLHFHVSKSDDHGHSSSSSHLHGPPYGWDDRMDKELEGHDLYNLYEKLKLENDVRKLLSSTRGASYHRI